MSSSGASASPFSVTPASRYCVEDGITDETAGLLKAVAAAKSSHAKTLALTPGVTYRTSATVSAAGITIQANGATIKPLDGLAAFIVVNLSGAGNTAWEGGTVDCNTANVKSGSAVGLYVGGAFSSISISDVTVSGATGHGIQIIAPTVVTDPSNAASGTVTLNRCTVSGAGTYGVMVSRCAGVSISDCTAAENTAGGITATLCQDINISGCTANGNGAHGILLMYCTATGVSENRCKNNSQSGVCMGGGSSTNIASTHGAITGNVCSSNTQHGIQLDLTVTAGTPVEWHGTVTGNVCAQNGIHGIYVNNTSALSLSGNACQSNTQDGVMVAGEDVSVSGNTLTDNQSYGLAFFTFGSGNTVGTNVSTGNVSANYYVDSTATPAPIFATTSTTVPT